MPARGRIETPDDPRDLPGDFAHRAAIDVRFADTDAMGHVNNAVYLTYCEMARIRYWTDVTGEPDRGRPRGRREPDPGRGAHHLSRPGVPRRDASPSRRGRRTSAARRFTLEHRLTARRSGGGPRLVATSDSVMVRYDYATDRPAVARRPEFVAAIETFEGRALR